MPQWKLVYVRDRPIRRLELYGESFRFCKHTGRKSRDVKRELDANAIAIFNKCPSQPPITQIEIHMNQGLVHALLAEPRLNPEKLRTTESEAFPESAPRLHRFQFARQPNWQQLVNHHRSSQRACLNHARRNKNGVIGGDNSRLLPASRH